MHFKWLAHHIDKARGETNFSTNVMKIYIHSLNFLAKALWRIVRYHLALTSNDNILSPNQMGIIAAITAELELNTL